MPDKSVKLTVKPDDALNGMPALRQDLIDDPRTPRYAVVEFTSPSSTKVHGDDGTVEVPVAAIEHIEPVAGRDADLVQLLLDRAYRMRTNRDPQPVDHDAEAARLRAVA